MYGATFQGWRDFTINKVENEYIASTVFHFEIENENQDEMSKCTVKVNLNTPDVKDWIWEFDYLKYKINKSHLKKDVIDTFLENGVVEDLKNIYPILLYLEKSYYENDIHELDTISFPGDEKQINITFSFLSFNNYALTAIFNQKKLNKILIERGPDLPTNSLHNLATNTPFIEIYELNFDEFKNRINDYFTKISTKRMEFLF
jgi:hypothetical protein